jgi:putative ABC transport system permease protein
VTTRGRVVSAIIRVALLAYPRAFRARFGDEMRRDVIARGSIGDVLRIAVEGLAERRGAVARWALWPSHVPHLYMSGPKALEAVRHDIRQAIRSAVRAPFFTCFAAVVLALGIGAATTIFTVAYGVLIRPLPYSDPARLVAVWSNDTNARSPRNPISPADFIDMQAAAKPAFALEGYFSFITNSRLLADTQLETVRTLQVSPGLLQLLGRTAATGRIIQSGDRDTLVLSDGFWRRRFGTDPRIVGRRLIVDGNPYTVAGVMPADFVLPYRGLLGPDGFTDSLDVDVWMAMPVSGPNFVDASGRPIRSTRMLGAIGRLNTGTTIAGARDSLAGIAAALEHDHPDTNSGWKTTVLPLTDAALGEVKPALLLLGGGVTILLLMACLNVANLVFARATARRGELAIRVALGASRARLVFQALLECGVLSTIGAAGGLLLSFWGVRILTALAPADLPRIGDIRVDPWMAATASALALAAGIGVGCAPALVAARGDGRDALHEAARGSIAPRSRRRVQSVILSAEIALAVLLTVGAGLLMRSFERLVVLDPGFRVDHVLTAQMTIPDRVTSPDARRAFYATLFERLRAIPGVLSAGGTTRIPLGSTSVSTSLLVEGQQRPESELPSVEFRRALYDYFGTMGIPIVRGRGFLASDGPDAPAVAVVNETLARRIFPNADPIGRRVRTGPRSTSPWITIVGVIGDVRHARLEIEPAPELYINALQNPPVSPFIALRTAGDPAELAKQLRSEVTSLDPAMTLFDVRTMEDIHAASLAARRLVLTLVAAFGVLALAIATVGVYGVTSVIAVDRTHEAALRLALGATPARVLTLIVRDGVARALVGAIAGVGLAAAVSPLLGSELYGVDALDPVTFVTTPCVLVAVAALASMVPGWRAMRLDPARVLNSQ